MATRNTKSSKTAVKKAAKKRGSKSGARSGATKTGVQAAAKRATKRTRRSGRAESRGPAKTFFWVFGFTQQARERGNTDDTGGPPIFRRGHPEHRNLLSFREVRAKDENAITLAIITSPTFGDRKSADAFVGKGGTGARLFEDCANCVLYEVGPA